MDKIFKRTLVGIALSVACGSAFAENVVGPEYTEGVSEFFSESTISGNVNFFMRDRKRGGVDANGNDTKKKKNLDHGSIFVNLGFNSGYVGDVVGADFVVYSTWDMWQNSSPDHEFNFWGVDNPYDKNPDADGCGGAWDTSCNDNGVSIAKAAAKFKFGESVNAQLGYFQPSVPSSLGVNWSFAPGTYRGGEIGGKFGGVSLGAVYADQYKAPWFKTTYEFQSTKGEDAGSVYSLGARYSFDNGISLDGGYGALTTGPRKNFHFKVKGTTEGGLFWSPQIYVVDDNEQYDSTAWQTALLTSFKAGQYSLRAEGIYTSADHKGDSDVGHFSYRLTKQYGGSNGAYDVWWNNRSDFNHDGEFAGFASISRDFSDVGAAGFSAGISGAVGMGAKFEGVEELKEYAYSVFMGYGIQGGPLKGGAVSFHYTEYFNDSKSGNWAPYSNAFQDETDFKLALTLPFSVK